MLCYFIWNIDVIKCTTELYIGQYYIKQNFFKKAKIILGFLLQKKIEINLNFKKLE